MSPSRIALAEAAPPGVCLVSGPGRSDYARGNLVFRCPQGDRNVILKVYRRRKGPWNELWSDTSQRWFEGKRGVTPAQRCRTEAAALAAWEAAGFDAPRLVHGGPPPWLGDHPALAMECVAGATLLDALGDPALAEAGKQALVARLGRAHARRHRRALEQGEVLLVQEHASLQHVLVAGDRLVTFDFEHAYRPGFPLALAVAYELSSTLRALWLDESRFAEPFIGVFLDAYDEPSIVREICRLFRSRSLGWGLYRLGDRTRRGGRSKTETMARIATHLG